MMLCYSIVISYQVIITLFLAYFVTPNEFLRRSYSKSFTKLQSYIPVTYYNGPLSQIFSQESSLQIANSQMNYFGNIFLEEKIRIFSGITEKITERLSSNSF